MPIAMGTGEEGQQVERDAVISSVAEEITTDDTHEFILWANNSFTIEAIIPQFEDDFRLDQIRLDLNGVRHLRDFLNSEHVSTILNYAV